MVNNRQDSLISLLFTAVRALQGELLVFERPPILKGTVTNDNVVELVHAVQSGAAILVDTTGISPELTARRQKAVAAEAVLFASYNRFVPYIVRTAFHIFDEHPNYDDCIQEGSIGLIRGHRVVDISRLSSHEKPLQNLTAYLYICAKNRIRQSHYKSYVMRPSAAALDGLREEERSGTPVLTDEMRMGVERAVRVIPLESGRSFGSSREFTTTDGRPALKADPIDTVIAEDSDRGWPLHDAYGLLPILEDYLIMTLSERERDIVWRRLFAGQTFDEVGIAWEISRDRVRQIFDKSLDKMRAAPDFITKTAAYRDGRHIVTSMPSDTLPEIEPSEPTVSISAKLNELYRAEAVALRRFEDTPLTTKAIINEALQRVKRAVSVADAKADLTERTYSVLEDFDPKTLIDLSVLKYEWDAAVQRKAELTEQAAAIPAKRARIIRLEQELRYAGDITAELVYKSDRFINHMTKMKAMHLEKEHLEEDIEMIEGELFRSSLDRWLELVLSSSGLSPRSRQIILIDCRHKLAALYDEAGISKLNARP